jgi:hypothetical protein
MVFNSEYCNEGIVMTDRSMQTLINGTLNLALTEFLDENDVSLADVMAGIADFTSDAPVIHKFSRECGYCKGATDKNVVHCPTCNGTGIIPL